MNKLKLLVFFLFVLSTASASDAGRDNYFEQYDEMALPGHGLGTMNLSQDTIEFEAWKGAMRIQYAGKLPYSSHSQFSGSAIYRVKNAEQFFAANKGRDHFCHKPPKWIGIKAIPFRSRRKVWITLFEINDFRSYDSVNPGLCGAFAYKQHI